MSLRLQIIVGVLLVAAILALCNMVRKKKLDLKYALVWLLVGCVVLVFDLFPQLLDAVTRALGVGIPVNMLFFLGFVFSLVIIFSLTLAISHLSDRVKKLTQELALLEERVRRENEKNQKTGEQDGKGFSDHSDL